MFFIRINYNNLIIFISMNYESSYFLSKFAVQSYTFQL